MEQGQVITLRPQDTRLGRQQRPKVEGRAVSRCGPNLQCAGINQAGDYLFIPSNTPHQPVSLSKTEQVIAAMARNDPNEQESVAIRQQRRSEPAA